MSKTTDNLELKIVAIGNSRGVRLPKKILDRYTIGDTLVLEAREEGLLLRSATDKRLSWDDTYKEMGKAQEDWSDLDAAAGDGLEHNPW